MSWIISTWKDGLAIRPQQTDMDVFKIVKIRSNRRCSECSCTIPSKSYCFGRQYIKLCLSCGEKFLQKGKSSFQKIVNHIEEKEKEYYENKEKYYTSNTLTSL